MPRYLLSWLIVVLAAGSSGADETLFRDKVAPIFERRCLSCHNAADHKGDLSLETFQSLQELGFVEPGDPDASYLVEVITPVDGKAAMPKEADPLAADEIAVIRAWISAGAPWPASAKLSTAKVASNEWWSLAALSRPPVPELDAAQSEWCRTPIDAFIAAKHHAMKLAPAAEADRRTLIRRLYYDLIGLGPSYDEIEAFLADRDPQAYEKLVDRLLASPRYGERWGRHWLDVVHYGDTHGFDKDKLRENAWPYRDYVIRSLNEDKPYERFVKEQLAGDEFYPGTADGILGLGFLAAGPFDWVGQVEVSAETPDGMIARNLDRDDMVTTVMSTFVSLTVGCARCHHHKFDPITQEEYYGLQAVFAAVDRADRTYDPEAGRMVYAAASEFKPRDKFQPTQGQPRTIHVLRRGNVESPGEVVEPGALDCVADLGGGFELGPEHREGERRAALARWIVDRRNPLTWRSIVNRVWHYHFGSGIVDSPNNFGRMGALPTHPELLDWLAVEFRDGGEFLAPAQSIKALHRLIVTSSVYRQQSTGSGAFAEIDGANRYLWRANRRRLEAEAIRDTVLAVAGKLDLTMGGPGFLAFEIEHPEHSPHYLYQRHDVDDARSHRRSVYRFIVRSVPDPLLETLDCADPSQTVARRLETLTPVQALAMRNNPFMVLMAEHFAHRAEAQGSDLDVRLRAAYRLALGRDAERDELATMTDYARAHGLANACRLLFNTNEFVFVD